MLVLCISFQSNHLETHISSNPFCIAHSFGQKILEEGLSISYILKKSMVSWPGVECLCLLARSRMSTPFISKGSRIIKQRILLRILNLHNFI